MTFSEFGTVRIGNSIKFCTGTSGRYLPAICLSRFFFVMKIRVWTYWFPLIKKTLNFTKLVKTNVSADGASKQNFFLSHTTNFFKNLADDTEWCNARILLLYFLKHQSQITTRTNRIGINRSALMPNFCYFCVRNCIRRTKTCKHLLTVPVYTVPVSQIYVHRTVLKTDWLSRLFLLNFL